MITCDVQDYVQEVKIPCRRGRVSQVASRNKQREEQREIETFCSIIRKFLIFLCCFPH